MIDCTTCKHCTPDETERCYRRNRMIIDIKQYLKETNSVLLSEQAYKYLKEKASVIEKLEEIKTEMSVIEELEKIKAELQTEKDKSNNTYYAMKSVGLSTAIKIIDNHISEVKGENL